MNYKFEMHRTQTMDLRRPVVAVSEYNYGILVMMRMCALDSSYHAKGDLVFVEQRSTMNYKFEMH